MKVIDWGAIITGAILILLFPITNGIIGMGVEAGLDGLNNLVQIGLTQAVILGSGLVQIPATLLCVYIVWRVMQFIDKREKINIPKKSAKTTKSNMKYAE